MIEFINFIKIPDEDKAKVKFNMRHKISGERALDLLNDDDPNWESMNAWKTKQPNNNLNGVDYLIALAQYYPYGPEYFIFGRIFEVKKIEPEVFDEVGYSLKLMEIYKEYRKRLIVKINKPIGQNSYNRLYANVQSQLNPEIYEITANTKLADFSGYQNVSLPHKEMQRIINNEAPSWKQALSNVKGIYVITDTKTGKLYIGSASGNTDGIWQRWSEYANINNLTGGNKEFLRIINEEGSDYIHNNFKYSILEIFDTKTNKETIITRENYWKDVFDTKKHGMNRN